MSKLSIQQLKPKELSRRQSVRFTPAADAARQWIRAHFHGEYKMAEVDSALYLWVKSEIQRRRTRNNKKNNG